MDLARRDSCPGFAVAYHLSSSGDFAMAASRDLESIASEIEREATTAFARSQDSSALSRIRSLADKVRSLARDVKRLEDNLDDCEDTRVKGNG